MLSSLLTDMCLDTINSTTKFSPVISRCNFAGVNGMSLHLQTEKLESITLSWQLSAAPPLLQPGRARSSARRFIPLPPHHSPSRSRPGLLALPRPSRRGRGAAPPSQGRLAPGRAGAAGAPGAPRGAPRPVPASPADPRLRPVPPPHREQRGSRGNGGRQRDGNLLGVRGIPIYGV